MRKKRKNKKYYKPDIKYKSKLVTFFINHLIKNGKKNLAIKIFYGALKIIKEKYKNKKKNIINILKNAIKNASPEVEIKRKKIGGTFYNIPTLINEKKSKYLTVKWLIYNSKIRKEKTMKEKLANEIINTYNGIGNTIKKKNEINKIAESNKAFSNIKI